MKYEWRKLKESIESNISINLNGKKALFLRERGERERERESTPTSTNNLYCFYLQGTSCQTSLHTCNCLLISQVLQIVAAIVCVNVLLITLLMLFSRGYFDVCILSIVIVHYFYTILVLRGMNPILNVFFFLKNAQQNQRRRSIIFQSMKLLVTRHNVCVCKVCDCEKHLQPAGMTYVVTRL